MFDTSNLRSKMTKSDETTKTILSHTMHTMPEFVPDKDNWLLWKERLEIHFDEIECTEEKQKRTVLLKSIGAEAYSVVRSICDPKPPKDITFDELCKLLESQYTPPVIIFYERQKFYSAQKLDGETVTSWFTRVKKLAITCKFGASLDAFVVDKFVCGMTGKIFERLCEEDEKLEPNDALKKAITIEAKIGAKLKTRDDSESEVNFIRNRKSNNNNYSNSTLHGNSTNTEKKACTHCGWKNHSSNFCKFKMAKCHLCSKTGHIKSICKNKQKNVNFIDSSSENDNSNNEICSFSSDFSKVSESSVIGSKVERKSNFDFSIYSINAVSLDKSEQGCRVYMLPVEIDGLRIDVACDTGAPLSLMSIGMFDKCYSRSILRKCTIPFTSYSGNKINVIGEFDANIIYRGQTNKIAFVVTDTSNPPLLARNFLRKFKFDLIQVNNKVNSINAFGLVIDDLKREFSSVFDGKLGAYNICTIDLQIDKNAKPIFCKPRTVPFAWKLKIEKLLNDLVGMDVLESIDNSEWGTPLVPILKPNGDIRICGDYKTTLNKYLVDFKYPLPRIEEIFASLQGGQLFTKLDLSNAYNQLILDENSQKLCTWSTHIGIFKMKRLPFGVKPASAIFQKTIENLLRGIPNVINYMDDIVVTGKDFREHVKTLKTVLLKLQNVNLKLNLDKCSFFQEKITYLGFNIDKDGLSKTNERIESVLSAPIPKDIHELRAFNGLVNNYSKFIPNYAHIMSPLYSLLKKESKFEWSNQCQKAFERMKLEVTSDQVLVHFNPKLPIILESDASQYAIAGVLSHRFSDGSKKPIAFISRALSKSEKNYSVIDKEALAIIFSVIKLRQYLIGNYFELATDHKPLLAIFGEFKGLPMMASARMQRWALILSGFSYSIKHVKGEFNQADSISRMPQAELNDSVNYIESNYINYADFDNVLQLDFKKIAIETRRDKILSKLVDAIQNGTVSKLTDSIYESFRNKSNELTVESGCILWGYRTVLPEKLRKQVLLDLHKSHLGIVKTKSLARSYIWWPKIDNEIEKLIKNCEPCQLTQPNPEKSSLIPWQPTDIPWSRLHIDFAGPIKNFQFLIVIDSYSKWVEVLKTKNATSNFVINKLRELFCRFGLVDTIVSDNGAQFTSDEYKKFVNMNRINHIFTAPGHPATNGQAENFVKTFKKSIYANLRDKNVDDFDTIINRFLADYRSTKHCTTNETPFKLIFGREMKNRFSLLKPPIVKNRIIESQERSIKNFKGKRNVSFKKGQNVYIRDYANPNKPGWTKAKIKNKIGPRNYDCIITRNNRSIKRHLNQIRGTETQNTSDVIIEDSFVNDSSYDEGESVHSSNAAETTTISSEFVDGTQSNIESPSSSDFSATLSDHASTPMTLRERNLVNYKDLSFD